MLKFELIASVVLLEFVSLLNNSLYKCNFIKSGRLTMHLVAVFEQIDNTVIRATQKATTTS